MEVMAVVAVTAEVTSISDIGCEAVGEVAMTG